MKRILIFLFFSHLLRSSDVNTFLVILELIFQGDEQEQASPSSKLLDPLDLEKEKSRFSVLLQARQPPPVNVFTKVRGKVYCDSIPPQEKKMPYFGLQLRHKGPQIHKLVYKNVKLEPSTIYRSTYGPFVVTIRTHFDYTQCCLEITPVYTFIEAWDDAKQDVDFVFDFTCHPRQMGNCRFLMSKKHDSNSD